MSKQTQKQPERSKQEDVEPVEPVAQDQQLAADTDQLLADIDDVLEENAQEFVEAFRQLPGE